MFLVPNLQNLFQDYGTFFFPTVMFLTFSTCSYPAVPVRNLHVPDSKSQNIPEVVVVRRRAGGVPGTGGGRVNWVKGGANRVSLQAT
jgi:hypothetical protein